MLLTCAQLLRYCCQAEDVNLLVDGKLCHILFISIVVSIANFHVNFNVFVEVVSVEVKEYFLCGNKLEDVVS